MVTKTEWISKALETLRQGGADSVKVERLAKSLGVTKGSFYWHFKDRQDLLVQTLGHWNRLQAAHLDERKLTAFESPQDRLRELLDFISSKDARHDLSIRLWAQQESWVQDKVEHIDRARLDYCEDIFLRIGFDDEEAQLRARLVYFYQVAEQNVFILDSPELRKRLDKRHYYLLIRR